MTAPSFYADMAPARNSSYVNGVWVAGGPAITVTDPASGQMVGSIKAASTTDAIAAVDAAALQFPHWSRLLPQERGAILRRWHDLILRDKDRLAALMTAEQGKPISEARGEIDYAASFIEFYAEEAKRPDIESVTSHLAGAEMEVWREPCGVAALITPWNFPCAMITRKAAAALAAGCTVVIHPSIETPLSAIALAELAAEAGFPAGSFNLVIGDAATIVGAWTADDRVRVLSFTGSTPIGKLLYGQSSGTVKRLVMELGGHAPFLMFADANFEKAIDHAIWSKFATSGQDCLGANRFFVERSIYDKFCEAFAERIAKLTVGPGFNDPDVGPLMHERLLAKQEEHVADAVAKGAKLMAGGKIHSAGPLFFEPTLLVDVPPDAKIFHEETFGPIAAVAAFDSEAEAIQRANDTEYGLIAYVHTLDPARIYRVSRALEFGMVAINRTKVTGAPIPFGGWKQSGLGREGGRQGLQAFTEIKYVCRDWN
ncbi:MAG: NAD-dependent succinate-semialdehyde dehydrogenase [Sphingorhabdus sp.]